MLTYRRILRTRLVIPALSLVMGSCYTGPSPLEGTETRQGELLLHVRSCGLAFGQIRKENVTARVTPASLYIEIRTGGCESDGALLGSSDTGTLVVRLQTGSYHVVVGNPTDVTVQYSLTVEHLLPGA